MEILSNPIASLSQVPLIRSRKNQLGTCFLLQLGQQRLVPRLHLHVGFHTRCRVGVQPLDVALSSAADSGRGDISVLLPVSALLIFCYWIANFVVPQFIMKDLQKDETTDNKDSS